VGFENFWAPLYWIFLVYVMAVGGRFDAEPALVLCLRLFSIFLIGIGLYRLGFRSPSRAATEAIFILLAGLLLILVQLIPLPPALWTALPGRGFVVEGLRAMGLEPGWMPLSLSPPQTRLSFLAFLPPVAAFIGVLSLSREQQWTTFAIIILCALAQSFLGMAQKFGIAPYFYEYTNVGYATGTFANRNFLAALLYSSIPLIFALAARAARQGRINNLAVLLITGAALFVIFVGLASAGSRAGILLAMVAFIGSAALFWGGTSSTSSRTAQTRWKVIAVIAAVLVLGQFGMLTILRLAQLDAINDLRLQLYETTLRASWLYFPFGSGFGTFVPIYQMAETPESRLGAYVNHAHNDWLELWLEGCVPVAFILLAFLVWFGRRLYSLWRPQYSGANNLSRAASLGCGLLLAHSLVDYPLRQPALAALFGLFCGLLTIIPTEPRTREPASPARLTG